MSEPAPAPASTAGVDRHALRAVVLAGGLTFEREVRLSSGTQVWEELVRAGVDTGSFRAVRPPSFERIGDFPA